jgi:hypothetical protein
MHNLIGMSMFGIMTPLPSQFPYEKKLMGWWLGVAKCKIDVIAFYILTETS